MVNNIHDKFWKNIGVSCKPNTISQTYNMGPVPRKSVFGVSIKHAITSQLSYRVARIAKCIPLLKKILMRVSTFNMLVSKRS